MRILFISILLTGAICVYSQKRSNVFYDFFNPVKGTWICTIQTRDDSLHKVDWQDTQTRVFNWKLESKFFEELALFKANDTAGMNPHGMHLMSYDIKTKTFYQSGYWANKAGRTFDVEGKFTDDGKMINGFMLLYRAGKDPERNRLEIKWIDPDRFEYRVFKKDTNGTEYVMEELIYRRKKGVNDAS